MGVASQIIFFCDGSKFLNIKYITVLLNNIMDVLYIGLVIVLIICNAIRCKSFVKYLNQISKVMKEVDLCRSVCSLMVVVGWITIGVCYAWIAVELAVFLFLHISESFNTGYGFTFFVSKFIHFYTAVYTIFIVCVMNTIIGTLACFEKLTRSCLRYTAVHPLKTIVETNNFRDFLGIVSYELCKDDHPVPPRLSKLSTAEQVEYLRRLHEDICLVVYQYNSCLNPQLLCGIVIILIILVVQLYSVIVHLGFEASTPQTNAIFVLNCMSVFIHAAGLFVIFRNTQQYKNMVRLDWYVK